MEKETEIKQTEKRRYAAHITMTFLLQPQKRNIPHLPTFNDLNLLEKVAEYLCTNYVDYDFKFAYVTENFIELYIESKSLAEPVESDIASIATLAYIRSFVEKESLDNSSFEDDSYTLYKIGTMQIPVFRCTLATIENDNSALSLFKNMNKYWIKESQMIYPNWDGLLDCRKYGVIICFDGESCSGNRRIERSYHTESATDFIKDDSKLKQYICDEMHYDTVSLEKKFKKTYEMLMEQSKENLANYLACQAVFGTDKMKLEE